MFYLGEFLSSDMLSGMKLETCASRVCEKCNTVTNARTKLDYHQVLWLMSQEEWNRGKIQLKTLLGKVPFDTMECECDRCQTTTKRKEYTTISESPQQLLYINVCRSSNMVDKSVANKAYYIPDEERY